MADFLLPNLEDLLDEATGVLPFGPSEDIDCSICRENFVITDANHLNAPIRLPCSGQHLVCRLCLKEWLLECIRGDLPGTYQEDSDEVEDSDSADDSDFEEHESGPDKSDVQDDDPNDSDFVADSLSEDSGDESDPEADGGVALAEA
ncbi:MAG: hypothetical protein Q9157_001722 [Trypethelium eluteriae]